MFFSTLIVCPGYQPDGVEGAVFDHDKYGTIITILLPCAQEYEIEAVRNAPITFYLSKLFGAIYLSIDVGRVLLFDCPYSIHRVSPTERQRHDEPGPGTGLTAPIILVDSETGIIKEIRVTRLNRQFSLLLQKLILQQIEEVISAK